MTAAIDAPFLEDQAAWSDATFGPGPRTKQAIRHMRDEIDEIEANPHDVEEWADLILIAFDGARRHGWQPQQIIAEIRSKATVNRNRTWPDWRTAPADKPLHHESETR